MVNYSRDEFANIIESAVAILHKDHEFLLKENDINERTVTSQLRAILDDLIPEYNVDAEYNRMWQKKNDSGELVYDTKKSPRIPQKKEMTDDTVETAVVSATQIMSDDIEATTVFPDIIVHKRGTDTNLLAIEVKMEWKNSKSEEDREKLRGYTQRELSYDLGAYVEIGENGLSKEIEWFQNGSELKEEQRVAAPAKE